MSGLIYGAIVVMWVAFLVPMWLKRHDNAGEAKSVDRFSASMKVLARRTAAADLEASEPAANRTWEPRFAAARQRISSGARGGLVARRPSPRQPISVAARRRRVLAMLVAVCVVVAGLAALGQVPWVAVAIVALLAIGYVAPVAYLAHRARSAPQSGRAVIGRNGPVRLAAAALTVDDASHTVKITPAPVRRADARRGETAPVAGAPVAGHTHDHLDEGAAPDGFDGPRVGWDPVPVPTPMYVNAPRAPRAVRSIDLDTEGAWTSGRLVADAKAAAAAAVSRSRHHQAETEPAQRAVGD